MSEDLRDAGGYTPGQIRALKIAIAIMTAAIVVGLAVLLGTIAYRAVNSNPVATALREPSTEDEAAAPIDLAALYPGSQPVVQAKLPPGAHIAALTAWGDKVLLSVQDHGGSSLLVFDPKSGKIEPMARLK